MRLRETRTGEVRVAVVVSRKIGKAVVRNRVRRRLREALLALLRERGGEHSFDVMIIAKPSAAEATFADLKASLRTALARGGVA